MITITASSPSRRHLGRARDRNRIRAWSGGFEHSEDDACIDVMVQDLVMADDESGANRHLGFLFLYEVLRGG